MKILITGVAGFMGSHAAEQLLKQKNKLGIKEIYGIDNLAGGYIRNVPDQIKFAQLDLRQASLVREYINQTQPEYVYHLAADATEGRSQFTPVSAIENNLNAFINLLTPLIDTGCLQKIVITSSMSVYGKQNPPFHEDLPRQPEDIYAIAKSSIEESVEIMAKVHKFRYTIIRPHNVYGPRQNIADPYRNVIGIFINAMLHKKNFFIYGNGEQKRAFTYIDDFTPYFLKSMFLTETDSQIINIGPEQEYQINEAAEAVLKAFGYESVAKTPTRYKPQYVPSRPQEVHEAYCTVDKAKKLLKFKHATDLETGIRKMVEWAKTIGPQEFKYLSRLEIENQHTPKTWLKKMY